MIKKTLIAFGLLAVTALSGCVVVAPRPAAVVYGPVTPEYAYADSYAPAVVVALAPVPVFFPFFGFFGGYGYGGYYGHGHWR